MEKYNKRAQIFLYFGFLLALAAVDWHWSAKRFPQESFPRCAPTWRAAVKSSINRRSQLFSKKSRITLQQQHLQLKMVKCRSSQT